MQFYLVFKVKIEVESSNGRKKGYHKTKLNIEKKSDILFLTSNIQTHIFILLLITFNNYQYQYQSHLIMQSLIELKFVHTSITLPSTTSNYGVIIIKWSMTYTFSWILVKQIN